MPTIIELKAVELSTFVYNCKFYDENSADVVPNSIYWWLTDNDGNAINQNSGIGVSSVQSSIYIVLTGSDLLITSGSTLKEEPRVLTIEANYDSSLGSGLKITDRAKFDVINLSAL
jgi:hypothetical protein